MEKLHFEQTQHTPEILFDPDGNEFFIDGVSRPEDVREFYYPIIEWFNRLELAIEENQYQFPSARPLNLKVSLEYFNSSSAKFLFDIFLKLKELRDKGQSVHVQWCYEEEDTDMLEAGEEMAEIAEMDFEYIEQ